MKKQINPNEIAQLNTELNAKKAELTNKQNEFITKLENINVSNDLGLKKLIFINLYNVINVNPNITVDEFASTEDLTNLISNILVDIAEPGIQINSTEEGLNWLNTENKIYKLLFNNQLSLNNFGKKAKSLVYYTHIKTSVKNLWDSMQEIKRYSSYDEVSELRRIILTNLYPEIPKLFTNKEQAENPFAYDYVSKVLSKADGYYNTQKIKEFGKNKYNPIDICESKNQAENQGWFLPAIDQIAGTLKKVDEGKISSELIPLYRKHPTEGYRISYDYSSSTVDFNSKTYLYGDSGNKTRYTGAGILSIGAKVRCMKTFGDIGIWQKEKCDYENKKMKYRCINPYTKNQIPVNKCLEAKPTDGDTECQQEIFSEEQSCEELISQGQMRLGVKCGGGTVISWNEEKKTAFIFANEDEKGDSVENPYDINWVNREMYVKISLPELNEVDGFNNTIKLVKRGKEYASINEPTRFPGAQACYDKDAYGHNDWFLPSKNELELLFKNYDSLNDKDIPEYIYLSSSFQGSKKVWKGSTEKRKGRYTIYPGSERVRCMRKISEYKWKVNEEAQCAEGDNYNYQCINNNGEVVDDSFCSSVKPLMPCPEQLCVEGVCVAQKIKTLFLKEEGSPDEQIYQAGATNQLFAFYTLSAIDKNIMIKQLDIVLDTDNDFSDEPETEIIKNISKVYLTFLDLSGSENTVSSIMSANGKASFSNLNINIKTRPPTAISIAADLNSIENGAIPGSRFRLGIDESIHNNNFQAQIEESSTVLSFKDIEVKNTNKINNMVIRKISPKIATDTSISEKLKNGVNKDIYGFSLREEKDPFSWKSVNIHILGKLNSNGNFNNFQFYTDNWNNKTDDVNIIVIQVNKGNLTVGQNLKEENFNVINNEGTFDFIAQITWKDALSEIIYDNDDHNPYTKYYLKANISGVNSGDTITSFIPEDKNYIINRSATVSEGDIRIATANQYATVASSFDSFNTGEGNGLVSNAYGVSAGKTIIVMSDANKKLRTIEGTLVVDGFICKAYKNDKITEVVVGNDIKDVQFIECSKEEQGNIRIQTTAANNMIPENYGDDAIKDITYTITSALYEAGSTVEANDSDVGLELNDNYIVPYNFLWSDNSSTTHSTNTRDWTNGYLVEDLATNSLTLSD